MAIPFQAIRFVMLDFDENWTRAVSTGNFPEVRYVSTKAGATLAVLMEAPTGAVTTINYKLPLRSEVLVIDQVVHVPGRCVGQGKGNTIKCG